jgi:RNA polymerase sigma-70 factor (ECF subfamily)
VNDQEWLARRFEEHRPRLAAVAYRLLGSRSQADDAVQEAWLRLSRADADAVHNVGGWLTTVVSRVCLDMLRSPAAHREDPLDTQVLASAVDHCDPEYEAMAAESVGQALLLVFDTLSPAERLAFVLHDVFAVPYREIAAVLNRSPNATKQLASRARQRVQAADRTADATFTAQTQLVEAFLAAAREGNFAALVEVLHPDVVLRADAAAIAAGAQAEIRGALAVAREFAERAVDVLPSSLAATRDGSVRAVSRRKPQATFQFTSRHGKIVQIDLVFEQST